MTLQLAFLLEDTNSLVSAASWESMRLIRTLSLCVSWGHFFMTFVEIGTLK